MLLKKVFEKLNNFFKILLLLFNNKMERSIDYLNKKIVIPEEYNRYLYIFTIVVLFGYIIAVYTNFDELKVEIPAILSVGLGLFFISFISSFVKSLQKYCYLCFILGFLLVCISIFMTFFYYDKLEIKNDEIQDPVYTGILFIFTYTLSSLVTHNGDM